MQPAWPGKLGARAIAAAALAFELLGHSPGAAADLEPTLTPTRKVDGRTLRSTADPSVLLEFSAAYVYAGGQRFVLYDVADAEQHFFVAAGPDHSIRSFYWIQFEHFLPGKGESYEYEPTRLTRIGPLDFVTDTKVFADYGSTVMGQNPGKISDSSRAGALLRSKGYRLPAGAVRARMFYLPDENRRKELMIIYVESLPPAASNSDLPVEGAADEKWPELAKMAVEGTKRGLTIKPLSP